MDCRRISVLLVDDDEDDHVIIRDMLREIPHQGYDLTWVETFEAAAAAIRGGTHQVCLIDYRLGERNGLDLLDLQRDNGSSAPKIILTGQGDQEIDAQAMARGAADYLVKGCFDTDLLDRSIRYALQRSQTLADLSESRQFFQNTLDSLLARIAILDRSGTILSTNTRWKQADGENPLAGSSCGAGENYLHICDAFEQSSSNGYGINRAVREIIEEQRDAYSTEYAFGAGTGRRWFNLRITRFQAEDTIRVVVSHEEITELKQTAEALEQSREEFRQSQKMEAIGKLAGGVAHDFNNLLTAIMGHTDLLSVKIGESDPLGQHLGQISFAADRAAKLTSQLLAFSRRQMLVPEVLNLNTVVGEYREMLGSLVGENIELVTSLEPDLGNVEVDPVQVGQVIINLALNSRDAMPDGGRLTIETENVDLDEEYAGIHQGVLPGAYSMLTVIDDGCGMSRETREHIFEPFFTTKKNKGTGLGLSTVYGIIKQSGGNIWVYSEPGQGSVFKVYLPRRHDLVRTEKPAATATEPPGGSEVILVAEDRRELLEMIVENLGESGYQVLAGRDGEDAMNAALMHEGRIDLLLTDVMMPRMGGYELAQSLLLDRPGIRVLFMSGFTSNAIVHNGRVDPGTEFIQKPFTLKTLRQRIREVLDASIPPGRSQPRSAGAPAGAQGLSDFLE